MGQNLTTGNNNIDIGNLGVAGESGIIRIGPSQTDTYLTGIIRGDGSGLTGVIGAATTNTLTNKTIDSTTNAVTTDKLRTATTVVDVKSAAAPTAG